MTDKEKAKEEAENAARRKAYIEYLDRYDKDDEKRYMDAAFQFVWNAAKEFYAAALSASSGWVEIKTEHDLPKESGVYAVVVPTIGENETMTTYDAFHLSNKSWTHYRGHKAWMPIPPFTVEENKV